MKACELACVRMMVSTRSGLTSLRGCGKDVCCHRFFSISYSLLTHAVVVRFSEDPDIVRDLVHLEEDLEENAAGGSSDPLACVRRAVWGMLYADDAGIVSKTGGRPC